MSANSAGGSRSIAEARPGRGAALALVLALALTLPLAARAGSIVDGFASVRDDGTLSIGGERVRLYGITIPQIDRTCSFVTRPPRCAPSPVLALQRFVRGFVECRVLRRGPSISEGVCHQKGRLLFDEPVDIAAWLVSQGWAFVDPGAPSSYVALERLAQFRERGIWTSDITRIP